MSRYVKISTIGAESMRAGDGESGAAVWEHMKQYLTRQIEQVLPDRPDLIVLPEMCDTPSFDDMGRTADYINYRGDSNVAFFSSIAKSNKCNIAFSTVRWKKSGYYLNSACVLNRDGDVAGWYDKNHPPLSEMERNVRSGTEANVIQLDIGRAACAICFDLNFDGLRLKYAAQKPEIIIFMSMFHGALLQRIWAHSCRAYFVGAIAHSRPSAILSPMGETLAYSTNYQNFATATVNLDYAFAHYDFNYEKFTALKHKYGAGVKLFDPGNIGYVLITSETGGVSAADMLNEFGIEELDDYFARSLATHMDPRNRDADD